MGGENGFAGKHALVVGGSGGIGKAVALGLARMGALVTITGGRSAERLEKTLAALNAVPDAPCNGGVCPQTGPAGDGLPEKPSNTGPGRQVPGHSGFLCKIGGSGGLQPEGAAAYILKNAPPPDILVISWGPFDKIALQDTTAENWRFYVESNLIFPGIMVSLALPPMKSKGWGRILLFGGTNTGEIRGFLDNPAYGAAKTALGSLAKSVAKNAGKAGVICNVICPGLTATEYTEPSELAWYAKKSPGGKVEDADGVAGIALAVLGDAKTNGAIIPADGGLWV